tara:strand:- start:151 stop:588 length:438 start_codon:yes stop_codon:yes gene_type:complete
MGTLRLNRNQLKEFLPDHESVIAFENLFGAVDAIVEGSSVEDALITAGNGIAKANLALALIGELQQATFETVNKNIKSYNKTFTYTGVRLDTVTYSYGSKTITKTLNYTGINLTSVVLSGDTPSRIDLTKTLTYSGLNLTNTAYT